MKKVQKEKLDLARKHAVAVLQDRGKLCDTAVWQRIPLETLIAMMGITYPKGKEIAKEFHEKALLHWHDTGFETYAPVWSNRSSKQKKWSDAYLMKTAIAETMKNRRSWKK